ncbi:MAG: lamin tail domain-containing protein, partial [Bacteroidota bacterium]
FLRASCFDDFVIQNTGDTGKVLLDILDNLDEGVLPFSEFMTVIFDEETSGLETQQKMFHIIFTLLENTFDEYVVNTFQENVQSLFNASDSGMAYYDVVLKDTINSFTPIFLPAIKANYINDGNKPTISGSDLAYLSNRFLLVFLAKNVSFMSSEFMSISARNMTSSLKDYRRIVDGNGFNDIAGRFFDAMEDDLNKMLPIPKGATIPMEMKSDLIQATVKFLNDTINVAEIAMGESTWTESRINTLSMAIEKMVANPDENSFDFSSLNANEVKNIINNLQDCDFKPQEDESGKLSTVLQEIGELQFKALLRDMPGYTAEYVVKIAEILLVAGIREILDFLEDIIEKASEKLKKEIDDLIKLLEEIEKQAQELEKFYNEVRKSVESFFDDLIDDVENLQLEGWEKFREGLLEFVDFLIFFADIDTYKENAKQVIERTRRQALNNLDNDAFEQLHLNAKNPNIPKVIYAMKNIEDDVITFRNKIFTDAIIDDLNQQVKPQDKASFLAEIDAKLEIETDINSEDGQKITTKGLLELKFKFNTIRRKENDEDGIHSISSNEDNLAQLQAEKAKIENRKDDSSKTLKESSIKIHSPVPINLIEEKGSNSVETLKFDNLPIFNKYVYLDIDFDKVPIRSIMEHQFQFNLKKMVDYNNVISSRNQKLHAKNHLDNNDGIISLLQVKIILNGHELDLKDFKRERNRLTAHVDESFLLHGNNSLLVLVIPTSLYKEDEFIHHINFFCDLSSKNRPSNGIYIDPEKTVINSQGNDHLDANSTDMSDKEQVAITNNTNKDIVLGGWKLSDAKGHAYEFDDDFTIRSGETVSVIVGESSLKSKSW